MGYRLSKIYTRTGDDGTTGLGDGTRVQKDHPRVEAFGTVDELNSLIGLVLVEPLPEAIAAGLTEVQQTLFDLGGELCVPGGQVMTEAQVTDIERLLDRLNADLPPLEDFVLPGGSRVAALCHVARTVARRAERRVYTLSQVQPLPRATLAYLNRLSDLLFVIARSLNRAEGQPETLWRSRRRGRD